MTYFETKEKKDCNGCGVCFLKCPTHAIKMEEDYEGFIYPKIDKTKCINCGLCKRICPNKDYATNEDTKCYIAINKNDTIVKKSTSGGIFYLLAKYVIDNNGIVCGAAYDKNLNVVHKCIEKIQDIDLLQGAKYVKSDIKNCFIEVKKNIDCDRMVLFSGTPCQCQGIRSFIGNNNNLITCDLICHANPSPKIFNMYKKNIELINNKKIKKIIFRNKSKGWHYSTPTIVFDDNSTIEERTFYNAFGSELINRPSCNSCHFCTINRLSDFTIGDMWGINEIDPTIEDKNTGISLLCINTIKAKNIMSKIKNNMILKEIEKNMALKYNHNSNVSQHINRERFFKDIKNNKITENNLIASINKNLKISVIQRIIIKIKKVLKFEI